MSVTGMERAPNCQKHVRFGATLIELMVVILIILMVSAMTMRVAAPALESRRIREAARMVEVAVNRARNRALQTGLPAGIWLDRMPGLSEASMTMSYCEVPDSYGGDFPNSGVSVIIEQFGNDAYGEAPGEDESLAILVPHLIDYRPGRSGATLNNNLRMMGLDVWHTADPKVQQVVRPGDQIQFNFKGPRFTLESTDNHPSPQIAQAIRDRYNNQPMWYFARALRRYVRRSASQVVYSYTQDGYYIHDWYHNGAPAVNGYGIYFANTRLSKGTPNRNDDVDEFFSAPPSRYRIFRQPVKSSDPPVTLPEGAVIDLNYSGTRLLNFHPRLDPEYTENLRYGLDDLERVTPPNPYTGTFWTWQNEPARIAPPQYPDDTSPIIISFDPNGLIDRVFTRYWRGRSPRPRDESKQGSWEWTVDRIGEPIFLLIGRREKLPAPSGPGAFDAQINSNWADNRNIWITIHPQTGYIGASESADVPIDVVQKGLLGHQLGSGWTVPHPSEPSSGTFFSMPGGGRAVDYNAGRYYNGLDHMGFGARRIARQQMIMGGR